MNNTMSHLLFPFYTVKATQTVTGAQKKAQRKVARETCFSKSIYTMYITNAHCND